MKYTLDFFETNDFKCVLTQEIIDSINFLAKKVGAPTYVKTPNFKKKSKSNWESLRNFKVTKLEVKDTKLTEISQLLNKITNSNYDDILIKITKVLSSETNSKEDLMHVCKYIFETSSSNDFYSKMYAKLHYDLIEKFPIMQGICSETFQSYFSLFENIQYVDPETDYSKFCDNNRINDKRKAMSNFLIHLMNFGILDTSEMLELVNSLQKKVDNLLKDSNNKRIIEEISENIFILVTNGEKLFKSEKAEWSSIIKTIKSISVMNHRDFPGLSNKTIFKYMDIIDSI